MAHQQNISGTTSGDDIKLDNALLDVYSDEILFAAQPALRFEQIATYKSELGVLPGQTIKFLKYNALSGDAAIAETATIETKTISTATLSISVQEYAYAVAFSELLVQTAILDVLADAAQLLGNHYAVERDALIRDALLGSANVLYANDVANRAAVDTTETLDVADVREIVEFLAVKKAPRIGDAYIVFIHPRQGKQLRSGSDWQTPYHYADPTMILKGETGRIEGARFIETTHTTYIPVNTQDIWSDGADTGDNTAIAANTNTDVYQAIAVGDFCVGIADALPVEMRDDGVVDFGRTHRIAWYGIFGAGLLETGHSLVMETSG